MTISNNSRDAIGPVVTEVYVETSKVEETKV